MTLFQRVRSSAFLKDSSSVFWGNIIGQAILFLSSLVIAKLFTSDEFGIYSLYVAIVSLLMLIPSLRLDQAIMLAETKQEISLMAKVILFNISIFVLLALVLGYSIKFFFNLSFFDQPYIILLIVGGAALASGFNLGLQILNRLSLFKKIGQAKVTQGVTMAGVQIVTGWKTALGSTGLILGKLTADFASIFTIFRRISNEKLPFQEVSLNKDSFLTIYYKYKPFVHFNTPHAVLTNISSNIPYYLLGIFFNNYVIGIFGWVSRSFYAPMSLIANSIGRTFNHRISTRIQNGQSIRKLFITVLISLLSLTILPSLIIAFYGEELYTFVFGDEWSEAGLYALYLMPWYISSFCVSPISFLPQALGKQKTMLFFEILSVITRSVFLLAGGYLASISAALIGYSISGAFILIMMIVYFLHLISQYETNLSG